MESGKYSLALLTTIIIFIAGCGQSDSQLVRKAQLVGHENIQLKKQLDKQKQEYKALEDKMASMQQDYEQQLKVSGESSFKVMEIVAQTAKDLEDCQAENEKLRQRLSQ